MLEDGIRPCEAALTRLQLDATDTVDRLGRVSDKVDGLTEQCAWTATALHEESTDRGHLATQLTRVAAEVADIEAAGASYRASVDTTIQAVEQNMEVCSSVCELFGTRGGGSAPIQWQRAKATRALGCLPLWVCRPPCGRRLTRVCRCVTDSGSCGGWRSCPIDLAAALGVGRLHWALLAGHGSQLIARLQPAHSCRRLCPVDRGDPHRDRD